MSEPDTDFLLSVLWNFWEHFFNRTLVGEYFWWRGLMVKHFNSVSLIFLNSQLYRAPPEWWLLFWCNEEQLLVKKTCLNVKKQRDIISEAVSQRWPKLCLWFFQNLQESIFVSHPSNLYFGFFYKLFQAATLQQKNSNKGPCKFWNNFEVSYRTPKGKYFCSF